MSQNWKPGINHIEFWISNLENAITFYRPLFEIIGWRALGKNAFSSGSIEIYFKEVKVNLVDTLGPRHICYQAISRKVVDQVGDYLREKRADIIRGPVERPEYSEGYYTIDFRDPDGYVIEVAFTPNMTL